MKRIGLLKVGRGLALRPRSWSQGLSSSGRLMLVCEPKVWRRQGRGVMSALRQAGFQAAFHLLPTGEGAKTWAAVSHLLSAMLKAGLGRDAGLVALGGGTVTDAAGFAAAIYMRGIPWVSMPTTLLGQVDGGIGGKTALDLPEGKNLAGAFHQPLAVVCDLDCLGSLPGRERVSGLAEALKCGLALDTGLWRFMRDHWVSLLLGEPAASRRVITRCAELKLAVVARDERETSGQREILNFGHTVGHALEAAAGLGPLRHGEAVILGMRAAVRLSRRHAGLDEASAAEIEDFLAGVQVPRLELREAKVLTALRRDKKARRGQRRFVLLRRVGWPVLKAVPEASVREAVRSILKELR